MNKILVSMLILCLVLGALPVHAQQNDCPQGYNDVAKWEVDRWDEGSGFLSGFEYGSEYIAIDLVGADNDGEINRIVFVVLKGPITHSVVKAGNELIVHDYTDNPLVPDQSPPPTTYEIMVTGQQAISHVIWCSLTPTAVTITNIEATGTNELTDRQQLLLLILGGVIGMAIGLSVVVIINLHAAKR